MGSLHNLRKDRREELNRSKVAVIFFQTKESTSSRFVNVLNYSFQGVLIESDIDLNKGLQLKLMIKNLGLKQWDTFLCQVAWIQAQDHNKTCRMGLEFLSPVETSLDSGPSINTRFSPQDLDFILNTRLLETLPEKGICSILNCMTQKTLDVGDRFITQGDTGDCLYIIQKGSCSIQIQKACNTLQTVAKRNKGEIIGEMALLTGELRTANVICESEMILWQLPKNGFDNACESHPGIREFLTELLTNRLEDSTVTGIRNVGRYTMTHRIGHGGWSFVYKGKHTTLNMPVAIKMMKHNQAMDEDFLENFRNEGKVIAQLKHPNIVQVYDIEELYRTVFIIMEHLEGESLEALLERKGALSFPKALAILIQTCAGMAYAHDHKIIHRDVKPANIFISKQDHIKLLDFGLACSPGEEDFEQTGTIHYMSPEQIEGDPVDLRADVYSLGIMAYEMFTGQKPFDGDDLMAVMKMHSKQEIPDPNILVPNIPEAIKHFIVKASAKSPENRYNSMHEIVDELSVISKIIENDSSRGTGSEREVTVLLVSHEKNQSPDLNKLVDEFSLKAEKNGFCVNIVGKTLLT